MTSLVVGVAMHSPPSSLFGSFDDHILVGEVLECLNFLFTSALLKVAALWHLRRVTGLQENFSLVSSCATT